MVNPLSSGSLVLPPVPLQVTHLFEPELNISDLIMWCGKQHEHSQLQRRVVYRVVAKVEQSGITSRYAYKLQVAFDVENPIGERLDVSGTYLPYDMKRIDLLDLGTVRMHFDAFVRKWAAAQGLTDENED